MRLSLNRNPLTTAATQTNTAATQTNTAATQTNTAATQTNTAAGTNIRGRRAGTLPQVALTTTTATAKEQLEALLEKCSNIPKQTEPISLVDKTPKQDAINKLIDDYNGHIASGHDLVNNHQTTPINDSVYEKFFLKHTSITIDLLNHEIDYSFESNNAGSMRKDVNWRVVCHNIGSTLSSRIPLLFNTLIKQGLEEGGISENSSRIIHGLLLMVFLPLAARLSNHYWSESNGGEATKVKIDGMHILHKLRLDKLCSLFGYEPKPQAAGPASYALGEAGLSLILGLVGTAGILNNEYFNDDDKKDNIAQFVTTLLVTVCLVALTELVKQLGVKASRGKKSAQNILHTDHLRRGRLSFEQETHKSLLSRTDGLEIGHSSRGRTREIMYFSNMVAGVFVALVYQKPKDANVFLQTLMAVTVANVAKALTTGILTHLMNHPKRFPELAALSTEQIRTDDIRNSPLTPYIDYTMSLAMSILLEVSRNTVGDNSSKENLYNHYLGVTTTSASNSQAQSNNAANSSPSTSTPKAFNYKAYAATAFLFDDTKFNDRNEYKRLVTICPILQDALNNFLSDFDNLKGEIPSEFFESSNHLTQQIGLIEKSIRVCGGVLENLQSAIEQEQEVYELFDGFKSNKEPVVVDGVILDFTNKSPGTPTRRLGEDEWKDIQRAWMAADRSTEVGQATLREKTSEIISYCCGKHEFSGHIDINDITNNSALGAAATFVKQVLKAEMYDLHTRAMLLASNLAIGNYIDKIRISTDQSLYPTGNSANIKSNIVLNISNALGKLLPIYTGFVNADFEMATSDVEMKLSLISIDELKNFQKEKGNNVKELLEILSRSAGMRANMTMLADKIVRKYNSNATEINDIGNTLIEKLKLLRVSVDHVENDFWRKANNLVNSTFVGFDMHQDGVDTQRVRGLLDLALNRIESERSFSPTAQTTRMPSLDILTGSHKDFLEKIKSIINKNDFFENMSTWRGDERIAHNDIKDEFIAELHGVFDSMTLKGKYSLCVTEFLKFIKTKLNDSVKFEKFKKFIAENLPTYNYFFESATAELQHIISEPFSQNLGAQANSSPITPGTNPLSDRVEEHVSSFLKSVKSADGDVRFSWDGNINGPQQPIGQVLQNMKRIDAHRHLSGFAGQTESLADAAFRMMAVGVKRSVIMAIPTILVGAGRMMDYYTTSSAGFGYETSPRDKRDGLTTDLSQNAKLVQNAMGENALLADLEALHNQKKDAEIALSYRENGVPEADKATKNPKIKKLIVEITKEDPATKEQKIRGLKIEIAHLTKVLDFYVVSTTVADTTNPSKTQMESAVLGQFLHCRKTFGKNLIAMMGENTFNKTSVNSKQAGKPSPAAVEHAILIAAMLGRPFNLHSDAAKPDDKTRWTILPSKEVDWFDQVKNLLTNVINRGKYLDQEKLKNVRSSGIQNVQLAAKPSIVWAHAGGIAADARDAVDHMNKLTTLMTSDDIGPHLFVDISWDKTYTVVIKNFMDYITYQNRNDTLKKLPYIDALKQDTAAQNAAIELTSYNLNRLCKIFNSFDASMGNFSSMATKAHLATRIGQSQVAALNRVGASTPFEQHKQLLIEFQQEFKNIFDKDKNLRCLFMKMAVEDPDKKNNNWMGFFINHSPKIMFGTDALVPYTKVTGDMQYEINSWNYYPFFEMINVMAEHYSAGTPEINDEIDDIQKYINSANVKTSSNYPSVDPTTVVKDCIENKLPEAVENITYKTFETLLANPNREYGDRILDAYFRHHASPPTEEISHQHPSYTHLERIYVDTIIEHTAVP